MVVFARKQTAFLDRRLCIEKRVLEWVSEYLAWQGAGVLVVIHDDLTVHQDIRDTFRVFGPCVVFKSTSAFDCLGVEDGDVCPESFLVVSLIFSV
jgi:hypothetical protein